MANFRRFTHLIRSGKKFVGPQTGKGLNGCFSERVYERETGVDRERGAFSRAGHREMKEVCPETFVMDVFLFTLSTASPPSTNPEILNPRRHKSGPEKT